MMFIYVNIIICRYASKDTGCQNEKTYASHKNCNYVYIQSLFAVAKPLTTMEVKATLAQECNNCNSTCSLHVIHPQLLKRKNIFVYTHGLQK